MRGNGGFQYRNSLLLTDTRTPFPKRIFWAPYEVTQSLSSEQELNPNPKNWQSWMESSDEQRVLQDGQKFCFYVRLLFFYRSGQTLSPVLWRKREKLKMRLFNLKTNFSFTLFHIWNINEDQYGHTDNPTLTSKLFLLKCWNIYFSLINTISTFI